MEHPRTRKSVLDEMIRTSGIQLQNDEYYNVLASDIVGAITRQEFSPNPEDNNERLMSAMMTLNNGQRIDSQTFFEKVAAHFDYTAIKSQIDQLMFQEWLLGDSPYRRFQINELRKQLPTNFYPSGTLSDMIAGGIVAVPRMLSPINIGAAAFGLGTGLLLKAGASVAINAAWASFAAANLARDVPEAMGSLYGELEEIQEQTGRKIPRAMIDMSMMRQGATEALVSIVQSVTGVASPAAAQVVGKAIGKVVAKRTLVDLIEKQIQDMGVDFMVTLPTAYAAGLTEALAVEMALDSPASVATERIQERAAQRAIAESVASLVAGGAISTAFGALSLADIRGVQRDLNKIKTFSVDNPFTAKPKPVDIDKLKQAAGKAGAPATPAAPIAPATPADPPNLLTSTIVSANPTALEIELGKAQISIKFHEYQLKRLRYAPVPTPEETAAMAEHQGQLDVFRAKATALEAAIAAQKASTPVTPAAPIAPIAQAPSVASQTVSAATPAVSPVSPLVPDMAAVQTHQAIKGVPITESRATGWFKAPKQAPELTPEDIEKAPLSPDQRKAINALAERRARLEKEYDRIKAFKRTGSSGWNRGVEIRGQIARVRREQSRIYRSAMYGPQEVVDTVIARLNEEDGATHPLDMAAKRLYKGDASRRVRTQWGDAGFTESGPAVKWQDPIYVEEAQEQLRALQDDLRRLGGHLPPPKIAAIESAIARITKALESGDFVHRYRALGAEQEGPLEIIYPFAPQQRMELSGEGPIEKWAIPEYEDEAREYLIRLREELDRVNIGPTTKETAERYHVILDRIIKTEEEIAEGKLATREPTAEEKPASIAAAIVSRPDDDPNEVAVDTIIDKVDEKIETLSAVVPPMETVDAPLEEPIGRPVWARDTELIENVAIPERLEDAEEYLGLLRAELDKLHGAAFETQDNARIAAVVRRFSEVMGAIYKKRTEARIQGLEKDIEARAERIESLTESTAANAFIQARRQEAAELDPEAAQTDKFRQLRAEAVDAMVEHVSRRQMPEGPPDEVAKKPAPTEPSQWDPTPEQVAQMRFLQKKRFQFWRIRAEAAPHGEETPHQARVRLENELEAMGKAQVDLSQRLQAARETAVPPGRGWAEEQAEIARMREDAENVSRRIQVALKELADLDAVAPVAKAPPPPQTPVPTEQVALAERPVFAPDRPREGTDYQVWQKRHSARMREHAMILMSEARQVLGDKEVDAYRSRYTEAGNSENDGITLARFWAVAINNAPSSAKKVEIWRDILDFYQATIARFAEIESPDLLDLESRDFLESRVEQIQKYLAKAEAETTDGARERAADPQQKLSMEERAARIQETIKKWGMPEFRNTERATLFGDLIAGELPRVLTSEEHARLVETAKQEGLVEGADMAAYWYNVLKNAEPSFGSLQAWSELISKISLLMKAIRELPEKSEVDIEALEHWTKTLEQVVKDREALVTALAGEVFDEKETGSITKLSEDLQAHPMLAAEGKALTELTPDQVLLLAKLYERSKNRVRKTFEKVGAKMDFGFSELGGMIAGIRRRMKEADEEYQARINEEGSAAKHPISKRERKTADRVLTEVMRDIKSLISITPQSLMNDEFEMLVVDTIRLDPLGQPRISDYKRTGVSNDVDAPRSIPFSYRVNERQLAEMFRENIIGENGLSLDRAPRTRRALDSLLNIDDRESIVHMSQTAAGIYRHALNRSVAMATERAARQREIGEGASPDDMVMPKERKYTAYIPDRVTFEVLGRQDWDKEIDFFESFLMGLTEDPKTLNFELWVKGEDGKKVNVTEMWNTNHQELARSMRHSKLSINRMVKRYADFAELLGRGRPIEEVRKTPMVDLLREYKTHIKENKNWTEMVQHYSAMRRFQSSLKRRIDEVRVAAQAAGLKFTKKDAETLRTMLPEVIRQVARVFDMTPDEFMIRKLDRDFFGIATADWTEAVGEKSEAKLKEMRGLAKGVYLSDRRIILRPLAEMTGSETRFSELIPGMMKTFMHELFHAGRVGNEPLPIPIGVAELIGEMKKQYARWGVENEQQLQQDSFLRAFFLNVGSIYDAADEIEAEILTQTAQIYHNAVGAKNSLFTNLRNILGKYPTPTMEKFADEITSVQSPLYEPLLKTILQQFENRDPYSRYSTIEQKWLAAHGSMAGFDYTFENAADIPLAVLNASNRMDKLNRRGELLSGLSSLMADGNATFGDFLDLLETIGKSAEETYEGYMATLGNRENLVQALKSQPKPTPEDVVLRQRLEAYQELFWQVEPALYGEHSRFRFYRDALMNLLDGEFWGQLAVAEFEGTEVGNRVYKILERLKETQKDEVDDTGLVWKMRWWQDALPVEGPDGLMWRLSDEEISWAADPDFMHKLLQDSIELISAERAGEPLKAHKGYWRHARYLRQRDPELWSLIETDIFARLDELYAEAKDLGIVSEKTWSRMPHYWTRDNGSIHGGQKRVYDVEDYIDYWVNDPSTRGDQSEFGIYQTSSNPAVTIQEYVWRIQGAIGMRKMINAMAQIRTQHGPLLDTRQRRGYSPTPFKHTTRVGDETVVTSYFAEKSFARFLNASFSRARVIGEDVTDSPVPAITKAINIGLWWAGLRKGVELIASLFHPVAHIWSYLLPGFYKRKFGMNPIKAYKLGLATLAAGGEEVKQALRVGLTFNMAQDFQVLRDKNFGGQQDHLSRAFQAVGLHWAAKKIIQYNNWVFNKFGAGLKYAAYLGEKENFRKLFPGMPEEQIARRAAELITDDFGGINYRRAGWSQDLVNLARMVIMAPDWTMSNFNIVAKIITGGESADQIGRMMNARFLVTAMAKAAVASVVSNTIIGTLAGIINPDYDAIEELVARVEHEFGRGNLNFVFDTDITPLAEALMLGGTERMRIFSMIRHFGDPLKLVNPVQLAAGKMSFLGQDIVELITGTDPFGRGFKTNAEFLAGLEFGDMSFTRWGQAQAISAQNIIPYAAYKIINIMPAHIDSLAGYAYGNNEAIDTISAISGIIIRRSAERP